MIEPGEGITMTLWLIVAVLSLIPIIIFSISYIRVRSKKLLITTAAFYLFFIKAMVLAMKLFVRNYSDEIWWSVAAILDIIIICLIAYSLVKKA
jgi:ABC-type arginine/histidine transport system permease subunit